MVAVRDMSRTWAAVDVYAMRGGKARRVLPGDDMVTLDAMY